MKEHVFIQLVYDSIINTGSILNRCLPCLNTVFFFLQEQLSYLGYIPHLPFYFPRAKTI